MEEEVRSERMSVTHFRVQWQEKPKQKEQVDSEDAFGAPRFDFLFCVHKICLSFMSCFSARSRHSVLRAGRKCMDRKFWPDAQPLRKEYIYSGGSRGQRLGLWSWQTWVQILALLCADCVTWGTFLNFSKSHFSSLLNEKTHLIETRCQYSTRYPLSYF